MQLSCGDAMGCVPLVFSNITAEVAPWHLGGWRALGQLHVPRVDFLAGRYDMGMASSCKVGPGPI